MRTELAIRGVIRFIAGIVIVAAMLFWPAGSWDYWNAWLLMGVLFTPILVLGTVMLIHSPALLRKRLEGKEKEREQRWVVALSGVMFVASFVVAGFNFKFAWTTLPEWITWVGVAIFLLSYVLYAEVMRENAYLSRTIEIQQGQQVVDTGLYGIVRHPMYSVTLLLFLSMPIVLGSVWAFLIFLVYPFIIAARLLDEEKFLEEELEGYREYKQKVKYRLIPFIW